jgi:hypothetical protein
LIVDLKGINDRPELKRGNLGGRGISPTDL